MTRCKLFACLPLVVASLFCPLSCGGGGSSGASNGGMPPPDSPPPAFANFEPAQTNAIRPSADGTRLFAVDTPNNSLSVFDVTQRRSPALVAEIPV
ncbi:MAG: hypothetical protein LAO09_04640 [Acidobacteriia bacterium]|nr:hypothetical protein [Terriglobia bacterium]